MKTCKNNECAKLEDREDCLIGEDCKDYIPESKIDLEELRKALHPLSKAKIMLEENYFAWNADGKRHAIESARKSLCEAHSIISAIYTNAVYGET